MATKKQAPAPKKAAPVKKAAPLINKLNSGKPRNTAPRDKEGRLIPRLKVVHKKYEYFFHAIGPDGGIVCEYSDSHTEKQIIKEIERYRGLGFIVDASEVKGAK